MFEEAPAYNLHNICLDVSLMWEVGNTESIKEIWYALELGCNSHGGMHPRRENEFPRSTGQKGAIL